MIQKLVIGQFLAGNKLHWVFTGVYVWDETQLSIFNEWELKNWKGGGWHKIGKQ